MAIETTSDLSLVGTSQIVDGSVTSAKIAAGAIGTAKINSTGAIDGYLLTADGSGGVAWEALAAAGADVQEFTSSGSWVKPAGKSAVYVLAVGGGGGGAAGNNSSGTGRGGYGGGGAAHSARWMVASTLSGTVTITIGSGGAGGTAAAASASNQNGVNGSFGGDTSFGTVVKAVGGPGGFWESGTTYAPLGRGVMEWGTNDSSGTAGRTSDDPGNVSRVMIASNSKALTYYANAGRGGYSEAANADGTYAAVRAMTRTGGGGCGGSNDSATSYNGSAGARGFGFDGNVANGGTAGAGVGSNADGFGGGGGGGGGHTNGTAGAGGNGYLGGGGGGGGGVYRSSGSAQGGNGGNGGGGYVLVISV